MKTSEARRFLNGLHQPDSEAARESLMPPKKCVLSGQNDPVAATTSAARLEVRSAPLRENPYSCLIDRLSAVWPAECVLTEGGNRMLDVLFERVCEAQRTGDPAQICAAVSCSAGQGC